jgi:hypothetical protein
MKDNTFAMAMGKIVAEAETEREDEAREQHRRQIWSRVRSFVTLLVFATVLFFAFCYRAELQFLFTKPVTQSSKAASPELKAAQDAAARDKVVDEVTK